MPVKWEGLDAFRQFLLDMPDELVSDASVIVVASAERARNSIKSAYEAARSSETEAGQHLVDNVSIKVTTNDSIASARVVSSAYHAQIYEYGTAMRQKSTGQSTGQASAHPTVIPAALRERLRMRAELVQLVKSKGFECSLSE